MTGRGVSTVFIMMLGVALVGYGVFEARRLIEGPRITITSPHDGSATSSPAFVVAGVANNIAFLTINDSPAYTNEQGHFEEVLTAAPGYTIVTVAAADRFGRRASQSVAITILNYCPHG